MTPEQIEEARRRAEDFLTFHEPCRHEGGCLACRRAHDYLALLAEWEERGREIERLKARVEGLLNQNQEIAASNSDHVRWHREAEVRLASEYERGSRRSGLYTGKPARRPAQGGAMTPEQIERLRRAVSAEWRTSWSGELCADLRALLAEWEEQKKDVQFACNLAEERGQEIKRLHVEISNMASPEALVIALDKVRLADQELDRRGAEVERLSEQLRLCMVPDGWETWRRNAEAEIERLRAELANFRRDPLEMRERIQKAQGRADQAEARLATVVEAAKHCCPNPCPCGSGLWPCHVDSDKAVFQISAQAGLLAAAQPKEESRE